MSDIKSENLNEIKDDEVVKTIIDKDQNDTVKMQELINEKNKFNEEIIGRLKRLQADFENYKRRSREEKEELTAIITECIVLQLLPVLDNFERALATVTDQDNTGFFTGIQMIYKQLNDVFEKMGIKSIDAIDTEFDPQKHEAVSKISNLEKKDGIVIEELRKGYELKGKLIRPSMVKVVENIIN